MTKLFILAVLCLLAVPAFAGFPCTTSSGRTLQCPLESGTCCKDGDYCCPTGFACNGGKCTRSAATLPPPAAADSSSQSMQSVLQSAANMPAPQVDNTVGSSSLSSSASTSTPSMMSSESSSLGTSPVASSGSADVPMPRESSEPEKASIIIMKNVNALYKGPPKNGAVQPIIVKPGEESSEESSRH